MKFQELENHPDFTKYFGDTDPELLSRFVVYHRKNPELWKLMERFALEACDSGRPRFSIWMIANRIRWYSQVETKGTDLKITNDYLALYSRLLMIKHNKLKGLFTVKKMKSNRTLPKE